MGQSTPFRLHALSDLDFGRLRRAVATAARQLSPDQVAELADALYDIRRAKRRRVELHRMIAEFR